jgi:hypothetical protein
MHLRNLTSWNDPELPWSERGIEQAAFIIQQNLLDEPMPTAVSDEMASRLEAFHLLTGVTSTRLSYVNRHPRRSQAFATSGLDNLRSSRVVIRDEEARLHAAACEYGKTAVDGVVSGDGEQERLPDPGLTVYHEGAAALLNIVSESADRCDFTIPADQITAEVRRHCARRRIQRAKLRTGGRREEPGTAPRPTPSPYADPRLSFTRSRTTQTQEHPAPSRCRLPSGSESPKDTRDRSPIGA